MKINKQILGIRGLMIALALLLVTVYKTEATGTTYTWTGSSSTAWTTPGNWSSSPSTGDYPGHSDNLGDDIVIIPNVTNEPVLGATPTYAIASLTINSSSSLIISTGYTLNVTGTTAVNGNLNPAGASNTGKLTDAGSGTLNGSGTVHVTLSSGTSDDLSAQYAVKTIDVTDVTFSFDGTSAQKVGFGNIDELIINNTSGVTQTADLATASISGSGTLTPATYNIIVGSLSINTLTTGTGSSTVTFNNEIIGSISGSYTFNNLALAAATAAVTVNAGITVNGNLTGSGTSKLVGGSNTITVNGSFSVPKFTANTSTVILNGTSSLGTHVYTFNNITINGTTTLTANLIVSGNLAGSGDLIPGTHNVSVAGNTTITTMTTGTGSSTTTLNGASPSINAQTFNNLTLNSTIGATLNGNVTVNKALKFTAGLLTLGNHTLTIGSSGYITGTGSSNYIVTNGGGVLERTTSAGADTFPIGDGFNPIIINDAIGGHVFDVGVANGVTANDGVTPITDWIVNRTWTVSQTSGGATTVTVTPQWNNTTDLASGGNFDLTDAFFALRDVNNTNTWTHQAASNISGQTAPNYTVTSSSFSMTSGHTYNFAVGGGSASALPVTFLGFGAVYENYAANLNWQTASEINNDYFGVERSLDGQNWQTIGQVSGHGNSQVLESYNYTDNLQGIVPSGAIYYRLKQVDFNGKFEYSEIRAVNVETNSVSLQTYPNPARNVLNLNWTNADNSNCTVKLINTNGSTVYTQNVSGLGLKSSQIDLSSFGSGTYILQIVSNKDVVSKMVYKE